MHKRSDLHHITSKPLRRNKKGLGWIESNGYRRVVIKGRRTSMHRRIIEQAIDRKLLRSEQVHHINGNKLDNRIENLKLVSLKEHLILHKTKYPIIDGVRKECGDCHQIKDLKDFNKRKTNLGYVTICRACVKVKHLKWIERVGYKKVNGKFVYLKK
jgi:hypothetical protein